MQAVGQGGPGVLAEYVAFPEDWFVRAPTTLDLAHASILPCAALTACFALIERGRPQAGQTVKVEGTGGVALFGLQIAEVHGATVIVSAGADKLGRAMMLGAHHCVDRHRDDWMEAVLGVTEGRGVDHVLEIVGCRHLAGRRRSWRWVGASP